MRKLKLDLSDWVLVRPRLSNVRKKNLMKLARFLPRVSQKAFDMATFSRSDKTVDRADEELDIDDPIFDEDEFNPHNCGTVGCACGYGPAAGVAPLKNELDWGQYSERAFVKQKRFADHNWTTYFDTPDNWSWCFSADWAMVDNTPAGAAARIIFMLHHGVPKNFLYSGKPEHVALYQPYVALVKRAEKVRKARVKKAKAAKATKKSKKKVSK